MASHPRRQSLELLKKKSGDFDRATPDSKYLSNNHCFVAVNGDLLQTTVIITYERLQQEPS